MKSLVEYQYYTYAGDGRTLLPLGEGVNPVFRFENARASLSFDLPLETPYRIERQFEVAIQDPQYYTAITFADPSDIRLEYQPTGCTMTMRHHGVSIRSWRSGLTPSAQTSSPFRLISL